MRNLIRTIFTYHLFVITGNGKIAASLDSDSGLFIRLNRALSLSVKYYPVVSTKIINAKAKGCLYIPFQLLLFCIGLSNSLSVQFNSIKLVKGFFSLSLYSFLLSITTTFLIQKSLFYSMRLISEATLLNIREGIAYKLQTVQTVSSTAKISLFIRFCCSKNEKGLNSSIITTI